MHLQQEPGLEPLPAQSGVELDHRFLDQVGRRALNRRVHRDPLGGGSRRAIPGSDLGNVALSSEESPDFSGPPRLADDLLDELADLGVAIEVGVDEDLGFPRRDAELLSQSESGLTVNDAEVDDFRPPSLLRLAQARLTEHLPRGPVVDVLARAERLDQRGVAAEMREDAKLDLRVVRREELPFRGSDECAPQPSAEIASDGYVLEIGIAARETAGRGDGLVERGVDAAGPRMHQRGKGVDVGPFELGKTAIFENLLRERKGGRQLFENVHPGGGGALLFRLLERGKVHLVEQDLSELPRRVDVELDSRELVDLRRQPLELRLELHRHTLELRPVDGDARELHRRQHLDERKLDLTMNAFELVLRETASHPFLETQHPLGALRREPPARRGRLSGGSHPGKDALGFRGRAFGRQRFLEELEHQIGELLRPA